jgi:Ser/Thr protein kinase RdoA (MazF antagonist)
MTSIWGDTETKFFFQLGPDEILKAVDSLGIKSTGRVMVLNSMENRVYEVEIESKSNNPSDHFKIIKFYRPNRWSKDQILAEHEFLNDLTDVEIPVIPPLKFNHETLFTDATLNLHFALFNKQGGRSPDELQREDIEQLGRLIARVHNIGATKKANCRPTMNPENYIQNNLDYLLNSKKIPNHLELSFKSTVEKIYQMTKNKFRNIKNIRVHGDCHLGNIIKREDVFHLIDFDDFVMGPAVQDLWMIIPGRDEEAILNRNIFLSEYQTLREFDYQEIGLIETLRTFRMINYTAWIAKRYDDPAFKNAFPYYEDQNFWEEKINELKEQIFYINEAIE